MLNLRCLPSSLDLVFEFVIGMDDPCSWSLLCIMGAGCEFLVPCWVMFVSEQIMTSCVSVTSEDLKGVSS